jgi:hypothetical protein
MLKLSMMKVLLNKSLPTNAYYFHGLVYQAPAGIILEIDDESNAGYKNSQYIYLKSGWFFGRAYGGDIGWNQHFCKITVIDDETI